MVIFLNVPLHLALHAGGELAVLVALHVVVPDAGHAVVGVTAAAFGADSVAELVDEIGVVDQRTGHLHELEAGVEHPVDGRHGVDAADECQGHLELPAEADRVIEEEGFLERLVLNHHLAEEVDSHLEPPQSPGHVAGEHADGHGTAHHVHGGPADEAAAEHEALGSVLLQALGDLDAVLHLETAFEAVAGIGLDQYSYVVSGSLHYLLHDHVHELHAVLQRAAELIAAVVGVGREELRDEVAVTGVYLHSVEPSVAGDAHSVAEVLDGLEYLVLTQTVYEGRGVEIEAAGGSYRPLSAVHPVRHVAAVAELDAGLGAGCVYRVGQVAQAGDDLGTHPQLAVEGQAALVDGGVGHGGHADSAAGHSRMVVLELLCGYMSVAHALVGRGADDAVLDFYGADLGRGEE